MKSKWKYNNNEYKYNKIRTLSIQPPHECIRTSQNMFSVFTY